MQGEVILAACKEFLHSEGLVSEDEHKVEDGDADEIQAVRRHAEKGAGKCLHQSQDLMGQIYKKFDFRPKIEHFVTK